MAGDRVEVPLDDHRGALLPDGRARPVEAVERRALVEQESLVGIDVFALLVVSHRTGAESDRPAAPVADGDEQAVPETVPETPVVLGDQTGRDGLVLAEALLSQVAEEALAVVRRGSGPAPISRPFGDAALG